MVDSVRRRRRRFLMGSTSPSRVEGEVDDGDEYDLEEVENLNTRVAALAQPSVSGPDSEAFTPANRLRQVGERASGYEREYRLRLLHRLLMRNLPLDSIANELRVSVRTVVRDRAELYRRVQKQAAGLDANTVIGDTLGFYTEIQGMALRMASSSKSPDGVKLAAMRTALTSRNDRHRFFQASGVFDVLQFTADQDNASSDLERLNLLISKIVDQDDAVDTVVSEEGWDSGVMGRDEFDEDELEIALF